MTIHEFGKGNEKHIVLIHPSMVMWDYFSYVWTLLEQEYHVIVPALPGYDRETEVDFTSVEEIAGDLEDWLKQQGCHRISCLYGCSMGGAVAARILADDALEIDHAVIDGGITPYQLPWIITRMIAVKDFLLVSMGKFGGIKLLEKAFSMDEYSKEDLQYIADIFKFVSYKTIWKTFDSCNNYRMPERIRTSCGQIFYWYGASEEKERSWDIRYFKRYFPQTKFEKLDGVGHGGMASLHPEEFAKKLQEMIS